jgi:hypothetical protein
MNTTKLYQCVHCGLELNLVVEIKNSCAQSPTEFHESRILGETLAYQGTSSTNMMRFGSLPRKEED